MHVRIEHFPNPRSLAVVQLRAAPHELPKVIPQACGTVWNALRAQNITGAGRHVSLYLDHQINLEVGVELDTPFNAQGEVVPSALPPGPTATATHLGPYQTLHKTHQAIRDWCTQNNHPLAGPNWEIYAHWQEAWNQNPSQIQTDIFYLLNPNPDFPSHSSQ